MKTCILSANCQGEILRNILNTNHSFTQEWEIKYYVNFHKTPIPEGEIESCDLLVYQQLGEDWGELASETLLARLSKNAKSISLPNLANYHLWPTAVAPSPTEGLWRDTYIDDLISRELSFSEIIYIAMRADFSKILDLPKVMEESLQREYEKNYARRAEIFDFIEQNWRTKQLFTTPNHPANDLIFLVVNLILKELQIPSINIHDFAPGITCEHTYFLPVHPFYIDYYGITHLTKDTQYPVIQNNLTYKEYLMGYVDARQNDIPLTQYFTDLKK